MHRFWTFVSLILFSGSDPDFWPIRIRTQEKNRIWIRKNPDPIHWLILDCITVDSSVWMIIMCFFQICLKTRIGPGSWKFVAGPEFKNSGSATLVGYTVCWPVSLLWCVCRRWGWRCWWSWTGWCSCSSPPSSPHSEWRWGGLFSAIFRPLTFYLLRDNVKISESCCTLRI